ncbi:hypothetical protein AB6A40_003986 [Gnathostoma spinigerum]|uniref:Uncharacterized protein n=1 Tax=Gnathostoma spinigerum TaxID=75299 RepID=A0ABD6EDD6_9BILA
MSHFALPCVCLAVFLVYLTAANLAEGFYDDITADREAGRHLRYLWADNQRTISYSPLILDGKRSDNEVTNSIIYKLLERLPKKITH